MRLQEVTNKYVYDKMQLQEVSHNLQETKCNCRRLQTLLFYTSGDVRKSPTICGKPPEMYGSPAQLAGNQRRCTEVSHNLRETNGGVRKSRAACEKPNAVFRDYLATVMVSLFFFCWMCTVFPFPKPSASSHFP